MQEAPTYRERSRDFVVKARRELDEDLPQASEKGWGAAAEIVKAIAEERGWAHRGHRELQTAVNRLRNETGDRDLQRLFAIASDLHRNFYENWYDRPAVESGIQDVERFVAKVENLLMANR
jgi:hypothetical protein